MRDHAPIAVHLLGELADNIMLVPRYFEWLVTKCPTVHRRLVRPGAIERNTARDCHKGRFAPLHGGLRPSLTAVPRGADNNSGRDEETPSQPNKETPGEGSPGARHAETENRAKVRPGRYHPRQTAMRHNVNILSHI
jgi:hypothetical protein